MKHERTFLTLLVLVLTGLFVVAALAGAFPPFEGAVLHSALLAAGTRYDIDVTVYYKEPYGYVIFYPDATGVNVIGMPPIPAPQALALIGNREVFSFGFWPDENRLIIKEWAIVVGSGSTPRHDEMTSSGWTGWDVHTIIHAENAAVFMIIAGLNLTIFFAGSTVMVLIGKAAVKLCRKKSRQEQVEVSAKTRASGVDCAMSACCTR